MFGKTMLRDIIDFLFPPFCLVCKAPLFKNERTICDACYLRIRPVDSPYCQVCGRPLRRAGLCRACERYGKAYVRRRAVGIYESVLAEAIKSLKYRSRLSIAKKLGKMMSRLALADSEMSRVDAIVPVPLHRVRQRERGYNQALLLSKEISREMNLPVVAKSLVRTKFTKQQTRLSRKKRRGNVAGAFKVLDRESVRDKQILLVDDVTTTGATLEECTKALLDAGACAVYCLTAANALT
ncbi:ComF family protein [candidate division TA06 bacterium]|uniref:ComF family protein n=1 Tax=candidate division TA06 bacterium TaxID=2250710 RepID=A0A523USN4_UNCT6|nr:MAG: ComF family protein [candidate division TA06 bacterium]